MGTARGGCRNTFAPCSGRPDRATSMRSTLRSRSTRFESSPLLGVLETPLCIYNQPSMTSTGRRTTRRRYPNYLNSCHTVTKRSDPLAEGRSPSLPSSHWLRVDHLPCPAQHLLRLGRRSGEGAQPATPGLGSIVSCARFFPVSPFGEEDM